MTSRDSGKPASVRFDGRAGDIVGLLCIPHPGALLDLESELCLGDDLWYLPRMPFPVDGNWARALGSMLVEALERTSFTIAATESIGSSSREEAEKRVADRLYGFLTCLPLGGFPEWAVSFPAQSYILTHSEIHGLALKRYNLTLPTMPSSEGRVMTPDSLRSTAKRLSSYRAVYSGPESRWLRLSRGIHALHNAMRENVLEFRLHDYVWALEALIVPDEQETQKENRRKSTREMFASRLQSFLAPDKQNADILRDIYDLRCRVEHLHGWAGALMSGRRPTDDEMMLRAWQAENLALHAYGRILESPELLSLFGDKAVVDTWTKHPEKLDAPWGQKLVLADYCWKEQEAANGSAKVLGVRDYDPNDITFRRDCQAFLERHG